MEPNGSTAPVVAFPGSPGAACVVMRHHVPMGFFKEGENVWVQMPDGSQRAGVYVGEAETATWFGGEPQAYVVFPDSKQGAEVPTELITPRDGKD